MSWRTVREFYCEHAHKMSTAINHVFLCVCVCVCDNKFTTLPSESIWRWALGVHWIDTSVLFHAIRFNSIKWVKIPMELTKSRSLSEYKAEINWKWQFMSNFIQLIIPFAHHTIALCQHKFGYWMFQLFDLQWPT